MARQGRKKKTKAYPTKGKKLRKVPTGIAGLDEILHGGLPAGRTALVSGGPGSGKSVLGLEFLYRGAVAGNPGIFVTFEERAEAARRNALTLGWDTGALEKEGKLFLMEGHVDPEAVLSGDFNLKALLAIIGGKAKAMGASRIVFDSLDVLLRLFDDPQRERNELYALHDWLTDRAMTAVMTVKASEAPDISTRYAFLDFMADCVIRLDQRVLEQVSTRRLRIIKYRGSAFVRNECPFVITEDGIKIILVPSVSLGHQMLGPRVSSGHPRLDIVLGGGYCRGSCVLISGAPGTGKTTLANTFVRAACARGEKVFYIGFEESQESMVSCMLSPGIDLRPALKAGTLKVMTAMPEAVGAEEHLFGALQVMETFQPDHLVVDAISSCRRMGAQQAAFEYVVRLTNACKNQGITAILINQATGQLEAHEITGLGISSTIDTVIFLRFTEVGGELNRMLVVMKSRGSKHSNQDREFVICDKGIDIVDVYVGEGGVLTGAARQEQEAKEAQDRQRRQLKIRQKESEVAKKRAALESQAAALRAELEAAEGELQALRLEEEARQRGRDVRAKMRGEEADSLRFARPRRQRKRKGTGRKGGAK